MRSRQQQDNLIIAETSKELFSDMDKKGVEGSTKDLVQNYSSMFLDETG